MIKLVHKMEIVGVLVLFILIILVVGKYYNDTSENNILTLPNIESFNNSIEFRYKWGQFSINENSLNILSSNSFIYDEEINLSNYTLEVQFNEYNGKSFYLDAGLKSPSEFTSCVFNQNYVAITHTINNDEFTIRKMSIKDEKYKIKNNSKVALKSYDRHIQCLIDDNLVLHYQNLPFNMTGGIGIKINSNINVTQIESIKVY